MSEKRTPTWPSEALALVLAGALVLLSAAFQDPSAKPTEAASPKPPALTMSPLPSGASQKPALAEIAPRGGCDFADKGFGDYVGWRPLPLGRVLIPSSLNVAVDGGYDLLVHFHGTEPIRKELAPLGLGLVIAGLDTGTLSSGYREAFASEGTFDAMLASINREVALASKNPAARPRSLILSSWSAGYGAIARILASERGDVSAIVLLDSLYASYGASAKQPDAAELAPFTRVAQDAAQGGPFLFVTHTAVPTPDYASTAETASFLLRMLGAEAPIAPPSQDPTGLTRAYEQNHFFVRGYAGSDGDAHCSVLRLLAGILQDHVLPSLRQ